MDSDSGSGSALLYSVCMYENSHRLTGVAPNQSLICRDQDNLIMHYPCFFSSYLSNTAPSILQYYTARNKKLFFRKNAADAQLFRGTSLYLQRKKSETFMYF